MHKHLLINYDKQNYICNNHNISFIDYSEDKKKTYVLNVIQKRMKILLILKV